MRLAISAATSGPEFREISKGLRSSKVAGGFACSPELMIRSAPFQLRLRPPRLELAQFTPWTETVGRHSMFPITRGHSSLTNMAARGVRRCHAGGREVNVR